MTESGVSKKVHALMLYFGVVTQLTLADRPLKILVVGLALATFAFAGYMWLQGSLDKKEKVV